MMRRLLPVILILIAAVLLPHEAFAWGKGHRLIRRWAVEKLPSWQKELVGKEALERLCQDYTSLQDRHAGGKSPELDPYCIVPGVRLSLHDVNAAEPSATAILWYLDRIIHHLDSGQTDEAMKFLGVLCHWTEDPGCPSAHSSPVSEIQLKTLLPPPREKERFNYLYGAGGIMDTGNYRIKEVEYQPKLLGRTREEIALRIYQQQRLLRRDAAAHIVPIVQDMMTGDGVKADKHRAAAALRNAKHIADIIHSVLALATNRIDADSFKFKSQPLTNWLPEFRGKMIPHPYYVTPFMVNQAMDAKRQLHPLSFSDRDGDHSIGSGFGMGTPFSLDYVLAPGDVFDQFTCRIGLHSQAGEDGAVIFIVKANDATLAKTDVIRSGDPAQEIDVALPESDVLKLSLETVAAEGSVSHHNLTVWAEPVLRNRRPSK